MVNGVAALPASSIHGHASFHYTVPVLHSRGGNSACPGHKMS